MSAPHSPPPPHSPLTGAALQAALARFFADDGWEFDTDTGALRLRFEGENGAWDCTAGADVMATDAARVGRLVFRSHAPGRAAPGSGPRLAAWAARQNLGTVLGSFEVDLDAGTVGFKTSALVGAGGLAPAALAETFKPLVYLNVLTMDQALPALAVLLAEESP